MLRMNAGGGVSSDHESWETGSYVNDEDDEFDHHNSEYDDQDQDQDEDAFDVVSRDEQAATVVELDPASFPNDEAYARALQDAEDQEMAARLLALTGIHDSQFFFSFFLFFLF